jgi:hypothetical protein
VHSIPASSKATQPLTQQQAQAYWTAFTDETLAQVLLAVAGVIGPAAASFLGLTTWATALQTAAANALSAANGAQTTANTANGQATTQAGWWSRLPEDLWIIFADPFHVVYQYGATTDTPTTLGTNGLRTFCAAQADIKLLLGQTSAAATTATVGADPGAAIQTNQTAIGQVGQIFDGMTVTAVNADVQMVKDYNAAMTGGGAPATVAGSQVTSVGFRKACSSPTAQSISVATNQSPPTSAMAWGYFPNGFFNVTTAMTSGIVSSTSGGHDAITINDPGQYLFQLRSQAFPISGSGVVSIYVGYLKNGTLEQLALGSSVGVNVFSTQWAPTAIGGSCPILCAAGDQIVPIVYVDATQPTSFLSGLQVFGESNNILTYWSMNKM